MKITLIRFRPDVISKDIFWTENITYAYTVQIYDLKLDKCIAWNKYSLIVFSFVIQNYLHSLRVFKFHKLIISFQVNVPFLHTENIKKSLTLWTRKGLKKWNIYLKLTKIITWLKYLLTRFFFGFVTFFL